MSASNWRQCPQCLKRRAAEKSGLVKAAQDQYGKVSIEDFMAAKQAAEQFDPEEIEDTLREDYWIGVSSLGVFRAHYSCQCTACGYSFEFKHDRQTELKP